MRLTARNAKRVAMLARHEPDAPGYGRRATGWRAGTAFTRGEYIAAAALARNVAALIDQASAGHVAAGLNWYGLAWAETVAAAARLALDPRHAVVALAAASAGRSWASNVAALDVVAAMRRNPSDPMLAREIAAAHGLNVPRTGYAPLMRAAAMLADVDPWRALDVLTGPKVSAFARCVATSGATAWVAVDGHAVLAAETGPVERRPGITQAPPMGARRYDVVALAYALAGHARGMTPAQAQAIAWVTWRALPLDRGTP